jgi:hypothetical protein
MTEVSESAVVATKDRDVLAELDSIEEYLDGLIGTKPLPGQDANRQRLAGEFVSVRSLAQNVVELAGVYSSGVTHKDRLEQSMGQQLTDEQVSHLSSVAQPVPFDAQRRITELERQLAEARGGSV